MAGYCALGKIPCEIYIPKGNSSGKLKQIKAYGAKVFEVDGTREDVAKAAQIKSESDVFGGDKVCCIRIVGTEWI